ncbi:MAG TPA: PAN domain-containing protein [Hyalangium sp.]|nr:PAN domain-containing protein [Hyalangium sp.]
MNRTGTSFFTSTTLGSVEGCRDYCLGQSPRCVGYSYRRATSGPDTCVLLSAVQGRQADSRSTSGERDPNWIPPGMTNNTDMPGGDLLNALIPNKDPVACRTLCSNMPDCASFTYIRPEFNPAGEARCALKSSIPATQPNPCCLSGIVRTPRPPPPAPPPDAGTPSPPDAGVPGPTVSLEQGVERPGGDLLGVDVPENDPEICRARCASDSRCAAFTFLKRSASSPVARCYLKWTPQYPKPSDCCVSGVKNPTPSWGQPVSGPMALEQNTDRPGADLSSIPNVASAEACRERCASTGACAAFTFVQTESRCVLKVNVAPPVARSCCTSGVKTLSVMSPVESNIDRPGMDIQPGIDLPDDDPQRCQALCASNTNCQSFTLVKKGVHKPNAAVCYLKTGAPFPVANTQTLSGLKIQAAMGPLEAGMDRPGADIPPGIDIPENDAALCSLYCARTPACRAFTLVKKGVHKPNAAVCYLKSSAPGARSNPDTVSGVKW